MLSLELCPWFAIVSKLGCCTSPYRQKKKSVCPDKLNESLWDDTWVSRRRRPNTVFGVCKLIRFRFGMCLWCVYRCNSQCIYIWCISCAYIYIFHISCNVYIYVFTMSIYVFHISCNVYIYVFHNVYIYLPYIL